MNVYPAQSDHPLFRYLDEDERMRVEALGTIKRVEAGTILIRAGDKDSTLYEVNEGHLDIVVMRDGELNVLATVGPGDVLGEVSFIDDSPRTVSVVAGADNAVVRAFDKRKLLGALGEDPWLMAKFGAALCELLVERMRDIARRV